MLATPLVEASSRFVADYAAKVAEVGLAVAPPYWLANFDVGSNGQPKPPAPDKENRVATSYVVQTFRPSSSFGLTSDGGEELRGMLVYDVYTPLGVGLGTALKIAEAIRRVYRGQREASGTVYIAPDRVTPYVESLGVTEDGTRNHAQTFVPYQGSDSL